MQYLGLESFEETLGPSKPRNDFTRRWLQVGESPYPGYCRAPGSSICKPVLCNCEKLKEIWNKIQDTKAALRVRKNEKSGWKRLASVH